MRDLVRLCVMLAVVFGLGRESRAQVIAYSQPSDDRDGPYSDGVSGQFWSTRIGDNFVLSDPTSRKITEVTWWGSSEYAEYQDLTNFSDWVVRFYQEFEGLPGTELYSETFSLAQTQPIETGYENMDGGWEYQQRVVLSTPVSLFIGEPYWISVGAVAVDPDGDGWHWSVNYFEGDDNSAADHFDGTGWHPREGDVAFVLWGVPGSGCHRAGAHGWGCTADVYPNNGDGVWNDGVDGDCVVDQSDLAQLLGNYGMTSGATREDGDIYPEGGDGQVNLNDLGQLLGQYGDDCRL